VSSAAPAPCARCSWACAGRSKGTVSEPASARDSSAPARALKPHALSVTARAGPSPVHTSTAELSRGVIDAAEFVGPYQDRRLGLQKAAKYYYTTGWHEPENVTELIVNRNAWDFLPADLQAIVRAAASSCTIINLSWC